MKILCCEVTCNRSGKIIVFEEILIISVFSILIFGAYLYCSKKHWSMSVSAFRMSSAHIFFWLIVVVAYSQIGDGFTLTNRLFRQDQHAAKFSKYILDPIFSVYCHHVIFNKIGKYKRIVFEKKPFIS